MSTYYHSRAFSLLNDLNKLVKSECTYSLKYDESDSSYEFSYCPESSVDVRFVIQIFFDSISLCDALEAFINLNRLNKFLK